MSEIIKKNSICAVVVTYNRKELLCECIEALLAQTYKEFDILVVDNHSTDGTKEAVEKYAAVLNYTDTGNNLGGAGGFQYGIRQATNLKYDYIWLMDDDCIASPEALSKFIDMANDIEFGFLASKVLWTDGSLCTMNIQRQGLTAKLSSFEESKVPVSMSTFVSLFIPTRVVAKVGLPIKEFVIWTDDLEYTRRISRQYPCYVVPESVVVHKTKKNTGANIALDSEDRIDRYRYAYRNEVYLYRREGIKGILHILARTPVHVWRVLRKSESKKVYRIKVILSGTILGFGFKPEVEFAE